MKNYPVILQDFMKFMQNIIVLMVLSLACITTSCSNTKDQEILNRAETLMESHPDSALILLSSIDKMQLSGNSQQAQYALLMSMALDKNYIDTTTFEVLQPAIDYYLENGSPNEKLRTFYYQGVIFQNQGDRDNALHSYVKGLDIAHNCTDSLTIAMNLVAVSRLYNEFFHIENYISHSLKAANIYNRLSLNSN